MKKLFIVLVLAFGFNAQAQMKKMYQRAKRAVTGFAKLSQLHYFPEAGEVDLALGYDYSKLDISVKGGGIVYADQTNTTSETSAGITVGVMDLLYVTLTGGYVLSDMTDYTVPVSDSDNSKGFTEPILSGVIRFVDANSFKMDAKLAYQPSFGDHKQADATNDGDALKGGHVMSVAVRGVGLVTDSSQLALAVEYSVFGETTEVDQLSLEKTAQSQHNALNFEVKTLTEIANDLFFGAALNIVNVDSYNRKNQTTLDVTEYGSASVTSLGLRGGYELTPDDAFGADFNYLLNYSSDVENIPMNAEGWGFAAQYTHRF